MGTFSFLLDHGEIGRKNAVKVTENRDDSSYINYY